MLLVIGALSGGIFYAPLNLPHGATITMMTLDFWNQSSNSEEYIAIYLERSSLYVYSLMGSVVSNSLGKNSVSTTSFFDPEIDNSQYTYYIVLDIGDEFLFCYGVLIEFTYPINFLPLIMHGF